MKIVDDLLDLTLRDVFEKYVIIENLECGYYYGIAPVELIKEIYEEYNIEEKYPEAFDVQSIIQDEILADCSKELIDYEKLKRIMNNLGIGRKSSK